MPKAIRDRLKWTAGTQLFVEETAEGVLLKSVPLFRPTRHEDVAGMLAYDGPAKSIAEMDAAIEAEVRARHARGRY